MKYINPFRVKVLMVMFYVTGVVGVAVGLIVAPPQMTMMVTFMGIVNVALGGFFTYILLTQQQKAPDKRKRKKKSD
ncbi:hypothetical protein K0U27_03895 [archaeon]|nr:hypothetical protein [archaeon]